MPLRRPIAPRREVNGRTAPVALTSFVLLASFIQPLEAASVEVQFKNGRRVRAELDPTTDEQHLTLRFGSHSTRVTRSFNWTSVAAIRHEEEQLSREQVVELAQTASPSPPSNVVVEKVEIPTATKRGTFSTFNVPQTRRQPSTRVQAIWFDAGISNWDDDVEVDGLLVDVEAVTSSGEPAAASGILNARLWSMRRIEQDSAPRSTGRSLELVGRWSIPIKFEDDVRGSTTVRLPFQSQHADFNYALSSFGLLHLEAVLPGHGTFHHSEDGIRLKPYSPTRDSLQLLRDERFFPGERNGRK